RGESAPASAPTAPTAPSTASGGGRGWGLPSGQISATVSARSPTKSNDQPNSSGSTRLSARSRTWLGLASANDSSPVSAARAQPRSGSGVVAKYSRISRNLPLRDGVNSSASRSSAKRFTPALRCSGAAKHAYPSGTYRIGGAGVLSVRPAHHEGSHDPSPVDCR